jgi:hypothetical protein
VLPRLPPSISSPALRPSLRRLKDSRVKATLKRTFPSEVGYFRRFSGDVSRYFDSEARRSEESISGGSAWHPISMLRPTPK